MSSREIVTFQVGHYSNFVGTHWWNIQESSFVYDPKLSSTVKEINHDVLFREGQNLMGEVTFTPRLISLDLKGSLRTLRQEGILYDFKKEEDINWGGDVTLHSSIPTPKNDFLSDLDREDEVPLSPGSHIEDSPDDRDVADNPGTSSSQLNKAEQIFGPKFYDLDEDVKVWSDFLRVHLHPRSVNIIQEYTHDNSAEPFDIFGCGERIFSNYSQRIGLEDQIHFFTEECDNLQGFHILCDPYDGFGGITSWITEYLAEDFPNKGSLAIGVNPVVYPSTHPNEKVHRLISSMLTCDKLVSQSSLFVPMSLSSNLWASPCTPVNFPQLKYKKDLHYHTSAVIAASLDCASLPYRLETLPSRLSDITHSFHHLGRRVASLSSSLPFRMSPTGTLVDTLVSRHGELPWTSLTPAVTGNAAPYMQSVVLRGIPEARIKSVKSGPDLPRLLSQCGGKEEILKLYLTEMFPTTLNAGCMVNQPCNVGTPFPHIFTPEVTSSGWVSDTQRPEKTGVESIPVMTSLQSSPEVGTFLQEMHSEAKKLNIRKYHQFLENGLEEDEYKETLEHIETLYQCYQS